jgi:hypothetical protein
MITVSDLMQELSQLDPLTPIAWTYYLPDDVKEMADEHFDITLTNDEVKAIFAWVNSTENWMSVEVAAFLKAITEIHKHN